MCAYARRLCVSVRVCAYARRLCVSGGGVMGAYCSNVVKYMGHAKTYGRGLMCGSCADR